MADVPAGRWLGCPCREASTAAGNGEQALVLLGAVHLSSRIAVFWESICGRGVGESNSCES